MDDEKIAEFLTELTTLSQRYGLGINDTGELYELEAEDVERQYHCDASSKLQFQ